MKILRAILIAAAALLTLAGTAPAWAQNATVHGHVTNPAGYPWNEGGTVNFTTNLSVQPEKAKVAASGPIDQNGDYSVSNIPPGSYRAFIMNASKLIDYLPVTLKAGDNITLNFDMTRAEYQKTLTPAEKQQIEEYKKQHAADLAANSAIKNLNAMLTAVRADLHAPTPDFQKDVAEMKAATNAKPDASVLWITYGDALTLSADHDAAADRSQGKAVTDDPNTLQEYDDAVAAYKKGIALEAASKKPNINDEAGAYNQLGNALAHEGKPSDAEAAYENAAKVQPAQAGMYYFNEAAVFYNASQTNPAMSQEAVEAADKAIAADPTKADPYYIKGQILLQKATLDPKTQKLVAPPGCVDAYQKYLEIDPNGKFASMVESILQSLGQKVQTHYRAHH